MQRLINRNPWESDRRVDFNWWLRDEVSCDYCMYRNSKTCDYCSYNRSKKPFFAYQ